MCKVGVNGAAAPGKLQNVVLSNPIDCMIPALQNGSQSFFHFTQLSFFISCVDRVHDGVQSCVGMGCSPRKTAKCRSQQSHRLHGPSSPKRITIIFYSTQLSFFISCMNRVHSIPTLLYLLVLEENHCSHV